MSSLVIFSVDVGRLAAFYEAVLGVRPRAEPTGDLRLVNDREEVVIHSIPDGMARSV
ncbi:MAG: hypothetical protein ABSC90_02200 [Acidimicrobiales bacterium]|jgi:catechol-2,3-dioxygenase